MPIQKTVRQPFGFEKTGTFFQEISAGVRPSIDGLRLANFLPVVKFDRHLETHKTVLAGTYMTTQYRLSLPGVPTIVARKAVPNMGLTGTLAVPPTSFLAGVAEVENDPDPLEVDPAGNPFLQRHLVYKSVSSQPLGGLDSGDIGFTVHPETGMGGVVAELIDSIDANGDAGHNGMPAVRAGLRPTKPIGYSIHDLFTAAYEEIFLSFPGAGPEHITLGTDYYYEIPLRVFNQVNSAESVSMGMNVNVAGPGVYGNPSAQLPLMDAAVYQAATPSAPVRQWQPGDLLMTDWKGRLILWTGGIDPVDQIVGRVVDVQEIRPAGGQKDKRELVRAFPDSGLGPSRQNQGVSQWLDAPWDPDMVTTQPAGVKAAYSARIQTVLTS